MKEEIRIKLKSYDHFLLDDSVKKIIEISKSTGSKIVGPSPLPTKKEVFTILRAPHVNKPAREQFERRTHKRLLILLKPSQETLFALQKIDLPTGVEIEIKL